MISVKDRAPLYPGRVDLAPVAGVPNRYDLTRADSPTDPGTPLNRRTMQLLQGDIRTYPIAPGNTVSAGDVVDVVGGEVVGDRVPAGSLSIGSTVKIKENGVFVDYLVVHQGLPSAMYDTSCNGTWIIRKNLLESRQWNATNSNDYANSAIASFLNGSFFSQIAAETQSAVKQVRIPYRPGASGSTINSGANGLLCKVFLLGMYELGFTQSNDANIPIDGAKLDYFIASNTAPAMEKRVALLNGVASAWWSRSPYIANATVWNVMANGGFVNAAASTTSGIRPAFVLDSNYYVHTGAELSQAIALQSGTEGQSIDIIYDGVAELPGITAGTQITSPGVQGYAPQDGWLWVRPEWEDRHGAKIETGSYIGTGSGGVTLTFSFKPSLVVVQEKTTYLYGGVPWLYGCTSGMSVIGSTVGVDLTWNGTTLSWTKASESAPNRLNRAASEYVFVAIGEGR